MHTFVALRRPAVPDAVPLLGGRPVRPALIVAPLLAPIAILAGFNAWSLGPILDGFSLPDANDGLPGWSFWGQAALVWIWAASLAAATLAYRRATRTWRR